MPAFQEIALYVGAVKDAGHESEQEELRVGLTEKLVAVGAQHQSEQRADHGRKDVSYLCGFHSEHDDITAPQNEQYEYAYV